MPFAPTSPAIGDAAASRSGASTSAAAASAASPSSSSSTSTTATFFARADAALDHRGRFLIQLHTTILVIVAVVVVPGAAVRKLELAAAATPRGVFALDGGDIRADTATTCFGLVNLHGVFVVIVVLAEDELAVEVELGFGLFLRLPRLGGLGGGNVGERLLVEQIQRLVIVFENICLAALLRLLLWPGRRRFVIIIAVVVAFRLAAVDGAVVFRVKLLLAVSVFFLLVIVVAVAVGSGTRARGILSLLGALLGLANVGDELAVSLGTVLVDGVVAEAADHALENVLDFGLEVALVLVAPDQEVGHERGEPRQHQLHGQADDANLDEAQAALDNLAIVRRQEEVHGLDQVRQRLLGQRGAVLVQQPANGGDARGDHVRRTARQPRAHHGEELFQVGGARRRVVRHVRDLLIVDRRVVGGRHARAHLHEQLVRGLTRALIVFLAANDDFAEDRRDKVQRRVGDMRQERGNGGEAVAARGRRHLVGAGDDKLLQGGVALLKSGLAALRRAEARDQLIRLLLQLRLVITVDDERGNLKQRREALAWQHREHVGGVLPEVGEVDCRRLLADAGLQQEIVLVGGNRRQRLIRLDERLERAADVEAQLRLLVEEVGEHFRKGLVKCLRQVKRQVAVAGQDGPHLLHDRLVNLDLHGLGRVAVLEDALEHDLAEGHHLALEVGKVRVAGVVTEDG
ncbi:hypothetical protein BM221_001195 [Beauveria bassiana]|uniref:Uncharacterized protein n=1 Tax=Beauveria bassiana TaxID=176275 RepID=A0A2N6P2P3_BEABA|nr:hypothetical protein BM221_001195 [Beauveria bassiana]